MCQRNASSSLSWYCLIVTPTSYFLSDYLKNVKKPTVKPKTINKMLLAASAKAKKVKVSVINIVFLPIPLTFGSNIKLWLCNLAVLARGVVLGRTFVNKSDWGFNNLSRSHHWSQELSCCHWSGMCVCVNWLVRFEWCYWLLDCCSVSQSWLVRFNPLVMFIYLFWFFCYVNVINLLFVWCWQLLTSTNRSLL